MAKDSKGGRRAKTSGGGKQLLLPPPTNNTASQDEAIEYYVSGDGMWINNYLRERGYYDNPENRNTLSESDKKIIEDMTRATERDLIDTGGTGPANERPLWRSVDASMFGLSSTEIDALKQEFVFGGLNKSNQRYYGPILKGAMAKLGKFRDLQIDKGFMSTTESFEVARDWGAFSGAETPIVLKIRTAGNQRGYILKKNLPALNEMMEQDEVILSRNTKWRFSSCSNVDGTLCFNIYVGDEA